MAIFTFVICFLGSIVGCATLNFSRIFYFSFFPNSVAYSNRFFEFRHDCHAPVDQSAQAMRTGWKKRRINRALSEFKAPKASFPPRYWATLPGKTKIKNRAKTHPIVTRCFFQNSNIRPNVISTTPDNMTTKSLLIGTQSGTWAWKSILLKVRWLNPAKTIKRANTILKIFCVREVFILLFICLDLCR